MRGPRLVGAGERLSVLCLGAHSDDIEIGVGGTLLSWIAAGAKLDVVWCVLGAVGEREREARESARDFLQGAERAQVEALQFKDGYFPARSSEIKDWFEGLRTRVTPDVIFTHRRDDAHQDHREVSRLTWNTFRDHFILEYEIPKWDGDIGQPNMYVALPSAVMQRKIELLIAHFATQRSRHWFDDETFRGLARLRGMECRAPERYAEAFFARKVLLD
jgi:LmbE family N-acetylglucosaminyl deacetylase